MEQLVQNRACRSFHLQSEPKWEVKRPVGSSQFGSFLLNIPQKLDSSGESNNPTCGAMEPEAEVVRTGSVKPRRSSLTAEKKKKTPSIKKVRTACQGRHIVC